MNHTPGPWSVDYGGTIGHIKSLAKNDNGWTPTICRYDLCADTVKDQAAANARLIAAAPELLEALCSLVPLAENEYPEGDDPRVDRARAVIRKATL